MQANIKAALKDVGVKVDVRQRHGVIALFLPDGSGAEIADAVAERVSYVRAWSGVHRAWRVEKDPSAITKAAIELLADRDDVRRGRLLRGPLAPPRQALPAHLDAAGPLGRRRAQRHLRPAGRPEEPRLVVSIEVDRDEAFALHRRAAGPGRAAGRHQRQGPGAVSGGIDSRWPPTG
ncbi:hypothetical protein GCM10018952_22430 [Streptosporangium vulgare]